MKRFQNFLYNNFFGRLILGILIRPPVTKLGGLILNTRFSALFVKSFIRKNKIDMSDYETRKYSSFNDFFTRKILPDKRNINYSKKSLISPADSALTVYDIDDNCILKIKNSVYTISDLIGGNADEFTGGKCLVFRLAVHNYHRYCYIDNGTKDKNHYIKGVFHTVMPISIDHNVFFKNSREVCTMNTENFGKVIQVEVGAMMVGKITNYHNEHTFSKGEEKGMFEFGGSTIVLIFKKDAIKLSENIISNSEIGIETPVLYGETIGEKFL